VIGVKRGQLSVISRSVLSEEPGARIQELGGPVFWRGYDLKETLSFLGAFGRHDPANDCSRGVYPTARSLLAPELSTDTLTTNYFSFRARP
jgi:hypothetical protein